ncbi:MAG TPA: (2Fe-2S)-binding protein [Bacillota bacterium]|jgi:predicted molibdopterin-dependent oxidoreductase YjgC
MRVSNHPILGPGEQEESVAIIVDGRPVRAAAGEPIAAALLAAGIRVFRLTTRRGEPRGLFCGIGRCTDCVMTVDGEPNVRTCVTPVRDGMVIETQRGEGRWQGNEAD